MKKEFERGEIDLDIPNHKSELYEIDKKRLSILEKIKNLINKKSYDSDTDEKVNEAIVRLLNRVGDLSVWAFEIRNKIEKDYRKKYPKQPQLAKTLYLEHYHKIHAPYDKLKIQLYNVLEGKFQTKYSNKQK